MSSIDEVRVSLERSGYPPIGDYAIVGDCHTAALISRAGSLDWLCLPHCSGPSLFAALLDRNRGGRLAISPRAVLAIERRYLGHSAILETTYHCADGVLTVTDFMPMPAANDCRVLFRRIDCRTGWVLIDVLCEPRPHYAQSCPQLLQAPHGWTLPLEHGGAAAGAVHVETDLALELAASGDCLGGRVRLQAGERRTVGLTFGGAPGNAMALADDALACTRHWWEAWCSRCRYHGPYQARVIRSCITLKLLTHQRTGAVLAAATTSLPESLAGGRNWDYRFCWLRDTSLLLQSFLYMGFIRESADFLNWLLRAARRPPLRPLYDLNGSPAPDEVALEHLEGYRGCRPVLIGNSANRQLQLDIYGELLITAHRFVELGGALSPAEQELLIGLGEAVRERWREPDQGIWETRGPPRHHTYSKLMCWVALDRLLKLQGSIRLGRLAEPFRRSRDDIRAAIDSAGYHPGRGCYVASFGGDLPDASLLLMLRYGYTSPGDPRVQRTFRDIIDRLSVDGLLYRYPQNVGFDGVPGSESLFVACNFWAVDFLARSGRVDDATRLYERLLALGNDVGLYAEQFDRHSGAALGNFPQAFSHSGMVTAAIAIAQARARLRSGRVAG